MLPQQLTGRHVMKRLYAHILLLLLSGFQLPAQNAQRDFLREFEKADAYQKIRLTANRRFEEIRPVYPLIKDTLEAIRRRIYMTPHPNSIKVYFDEIEAELALQEKNYGKAILIFENGLRRHAANINDSLKCWAELKRLFIRINNYSRALEVQRILESRWNRRTDSTLGMGFAKSSIYHQMGLLELAISERRREFAQAGGHDTLKTVAFYNDLGVFYNTLKNSDSAEKYLLQGRHLLMQKKYPQNRALFMSFFKGLLEGNLALAYFNRGDYAASIPLLKNDVYYSLKSANYESALNSYLLLVQSNVALGQHQLGKRYLDSAEHLNKLGVKDMSSRLRFTKVAAAYYSATGSYAEANNYYRQYMALNDTIKTLENEKALTNESISINIEKKELEHAENENALKQQQLEDARQRSFIAWLLVGILVLSGVVIILILNNRGNKKRQAQLALKNAQISAQKEQIEQSLKEKEILIREIHHRVKNNLQIITSMLSLQIGKVKDEKTESILRDARQRISSIALTHQMLYQKENLANVNFGEYVERLVTQVGFTMPSANVQLLTDIQLTETRLNIDNAVPLGLLLNELITNAYKHAFPEGVKGEITVSLREDTSYFLLTVSDNGIGMPPNFEPADSKTLGLELVYILADQLDAQVLVENAAGSAFTIKLKKIQ